MKSLCAMVEEMNNGFLGIDTYGHFNSREEREEAVMLAEDADFVEENSELPDDADELGEVFSGTDEDGVQ